MHRAFRIFPVLAVTALVFSACKGEEDRSPSAIAPPGATRCVQGIQRAVKASTEKEVSAIYYDECAEMFSQPACRDAYRAAAQAPANLQLSGIAQACRKAYCPSYSAFSFDICRDDFNATPEALAKTWPPLFDAILAREAGPAQPQVTSSMLVLYARLKQLEASAPPPETPSAPSGVPAPPSSASAGAPAGSAAPSAAGSAPPAAAGSARSGALVKEPSAKAKPAGKPH
jgi:hypothetical protein